MADKKEYPKSPQTNKSLEDLKAFWTPERMRDAIPAPNDHPKEGVERVKREFAEPSEDRTQSSPPQPPGRKPDNKETTLNFSAVPVSNPTAYPFSTVGKLFYTQGGVSYKASGSVIYNNTILTAAHVLFNFQLQQWAQNLLFIPAYQNGEAPLGMWGVWASYTLPGYNTTGDKAFDVGMATTTPMNIANTTGYLGLIVSQGWKGLVWQALGYPDMPNPPYTGEQMWSLTGPSTGLDPDGTVAVGMQSNFKTGASGGPWLFGAATANGLSSYGHPTEPNIEYSPYFDNAVWQMFVNVRS